mmetsp:Transcript_17313/g.42304  ORF Transcript_17313/g.42304 Transcript_17313/m.42304 type:complete len:278 (+) Transcript_17313:519-1352(+)
MVRADLWAAVCVRAHRPHTIPVPVLGCNTRPPGLVGRHVHAQRVPRHGLLDALSPPGVRHIRSLFRGEASEEPARGGPLSLLHTRGEGYPLPRPPRPRRRRVELRALGGPVVWCHRRHLVGILHDRLPLPIEPAPRQAPLSGRAHALLDAGAYCGVRVPRGGCGVSFAAVRPLQGAGCCARSHGVCDCTGCYQLQEHGSERKPLCSGVRQDAPAEAAAEQRADREGGCNHELDQIPAEVRGGEARRAAPRSVDDDVPLVQDQAGEALQRHHHPERDL